MNQLILVLCFCLYIQKFSEGLVTGNLRKEREKTFMANKLAAKVLVQMLSTKQIPDLSKDEMNSLIENLNL